MYACRRVYEEKPVKNLSPTAVVAALLTPLAGRTQPRLLTANRQVFPRLNVVVQKKRIEIGSGAKNDSGRSFEMVIERSNRCNALHWPTTTVEWFFHQVQTILESALALRSLFVQLCESFLNNGAAKIEDLTAVVGQHIIVGFVVHVVALQLLTNLRAKLFVVNLVWCCAPLAIALDKLCVWWQRWTICLALDRLNLLASYQMHSLFFCLFGVGVDCI